MSGKINARTVIGLSVVIFTLVFAVLLLFGFPSLYSERQLTFFILVMAFGMSLGLAFAASIGVLIQFAQSFYDLSFDDAWDLVNRIVFGLPKQPPFSPVLSVREGHTDPDGPATMLKLGGPGFLGVSHDSAVVTSQFGKLKRILKPGFHKLEAFERVWEVVDLRPQRRTVEVEFMTRDGIPAHCEADIRFRISSGEEPPTESVPYPFSEEAIMTATTIKRVKGEGVFQDWTGRISGGVLDGDIRDLLEQYRLDQLLNPQYWSEEGQPERELEPQTLGSLEVQLEGAAKKAGANLGIEVESVQLGPIMPAEEAISRQWLEFWQAKLQSYADRKVNEGEAKYTDVVMQARISAEANLVTTMLKDVQHMVNNGVEVPSQLIVLSFVDVLRSMVERDPEVQKEMFKQIESLMQIINVLQADGGNFGGADNSSNVLITQD
ncbi:MAG: SPFH domain-containing protein [Anaerolineae bacterium]|nr:SPFH domain-containing protein [Anaerolineae bacterium]